VEKSKLRWKVAEQREELENFASVLAHDLSAPIACIQLFAHAIQENLDDDRAEGDDIIVLCHDLVSAGKRTGALIDTLYQYTRAEAQVAFEEVDMGEVMNNALLNLKNIIAARGAKVIFGELPHVRGNAPQLTQLLQNLIGNAIKYCTTVPPIVSVTAKLEQSNSWLFALLDNGIGILPEHYQSVFQPFKRLHGIGEYEGSGLGLAICKRLIERHGGAIRCESSGLGKGTTFLFTLQGQLLSSIDVSKTNLN
jgi:signal transduction histidine kinase